jgi:hypothetical protein
MPRLDSTFFFHRRYLNVDLYLFLFSVNLGLNTLNLFQHPITMHSLTYHEPSTTPIGIVVCCPFECNVVVDVKWIAVKSCKRGREVK